MTSTNNTIKWTYQPNTVYEITINPDDKHQWFRSDIRDIKSREHIRDCLEKTGIKYCLYQEVSEQQHINQHSSQQRVHYHGVMVIPNESFYSFMFYHLNLLASTNDIQVNKYRPDYWFKYCTKQKYLFKSSTIPRKQRLCNISWNDIVKDYSTQQAEGEDV